MMIDKFADKLNKLDGRIFVIEEEVLINNGVYVGELEHDNINNNTINVYTDRNLAGIKLANVVVSVPAEAPWKRIIEIYSSSKKAYITYETPGDTVEADDINKVQSSIVETQKAVNELETSKVDKVNGKMLSTEDYTTAEKAKLNGIENNANNYSHPSTHSASMITGLPASLPANGGNSTTVNGHTVYSDVPSNAKFTDTVYNHPSTHDVSMITGLSSVAKTGNYSDLSNKPTIPTKTSQLANDSSYLTSLPTASTTSLGGIKVGSNLSITSDGVLNATGGGGGVTGLTNLVDGNDTGAVRHKDAKTNYTMGQYAIASGESSTASGDNSTAMGSYSTADGKCSTANGYYSTADGYYSAANGAYSTAKGFYSTANGYYSTANGRYSVSQNYYTDAQGKSQTAIGEYNILQGTSSSRTDTDSVFMIGNGTSSSARSNCFRVTFGGGVYGLSAFNSSGADYSEFFEWEDSNPNNEDRRGLFVALNGDKMHIAEPNEIPIGVISANPAIIGNHPSEVWKDMYLTDVWGDKTMKMQTVPAEIVDGEIIREEYEALLPVLNPEYDNTNEYINRENRKEWGTVGFLGQLITIDDGTCKVNGKCKNGINGAATTAESGYRVIKRLDERHIVVLASFL